MNKHQTLNIFVLALIVILLAACSGTTATPTTNVEEIVQQTLDAIDAGQPAAEQPTASYPLADICDPLAAMLAQNIIGANISISADRFNDQTIGLMGDGCIVLATGNTATIPDWGAGTSTMNTQIQAAGWQNDTMFSAGGPGSSSDTYRSQGYVCRYETLMQPSDASLCSSDEPLAACFDRLAPEQIVLTATISCAVDAGVTIDETSYPLADVCDPIAALLTQHLFGTTVSVHAENFGDQLSGLSGDGCTVLADGDGTTVVDWGLGNNNVIGGLQAAGWQMDPMYSGAGAGGFMETYRMNGVVCMYIAELRPIDMALCSDDEPIGMCFDKLAPEQLIYTATVGCTTDAGPPAPPAAEEAEPVRVEFPAGTISTYTPGDLPAGGVMRFVLWAMEGQQMTVSVSTEPADSAILIIWGADGTVLLSDHAGAASFIGVLPASQDYFIDIRAAAQQDILYTIEFIIPPIGQTGAAQPNFYERPLVVPTEWETVLPALSASGVPVILPNAFPIDASQPAIYPYMMVGPGLYEISLDFGADCLGAGACHFGSLAGMRVGPATYPTSTPNYLFDEDRAVAVQLDKGITGYFVEGLCGANCDDSKVFWVIDGYQFMVGIKGADQQSVVDFANAFINNSIR